MIRPATHDDVIHVAENIRDEDKQEVEALTGLSPLEALSLGLVHSDVCMAGVNRLGVAVAILGVSKVEGDERGWVWMLSTPDIVSEARAVIREGKAWLDGLDGLYPVLTNYVTESNDVHVNLIKHMGFTFGDPIDNYGVGKVRVIPFERT